MLKILHARLQQYMNHEFPDVQAGFRKVRKNQRSNSQHPLDHGKSKKTKQQQQQQKTEKKSTFALLNTPKPLTVWITTNCGKFFKRWEYQPPDLPPEKSVRRSRSNS